MSIVTHPRTYATVTGPQATFITLEGSTEPVTPTGEEDIRHAVVRRATEEARRTGTPVELITAGDRGSHHLLVGTDGTFTAITPDATASPTGPVPDIADASTSGEELTVPTPQPDAVDAMSAAESPRPTFLTPVAEAASRPTGWRGALAGIGINIRPSNADRRRADWVAAVSMHWAGCRTIAVANGKGGVGKTMTCAMLAAVYAREGGGNVLAWDNNDTRGTLGWRTEQGLYDTTLRDLVPAAPGLLELSAGVSDITRFVHHQATDRYDVLRSNPELLATDQRIAASEFNLLMRVAARYFRLVVFDSGNDESADRWLRMIDSSSQLVIPTLATPESAESAALLLDALRGRDERSADLADRAVVIVTQSEPAERTARRIAEGFRPLVRAVEIIPFDRALKAGPLRFDALHRRTRDAWLSAAASVAGAL
ncbi:ParA family protein [Microbacterium sp. LTA6]|uniref:MinD/ParA family ATP-binding protein n=1 Tax=unclassified Microbacterium TaxID=2609290 RepID=UPI003139C02D